ncbi:MAG: hypothetical protein ACRDOF_03010, partial [Gaiellaceae bacterium]
THTLNGSIRQEACPVMHWLKRTGLSASAIPKAVHTWWERPEIGALFEAGWRRDVAICWNCDTRLRLADCCRGWFAC